MAQIWNKISYCHPMYCFIQPARLQHCGLYILLLFLILTLSVRPITSTSTGPNFAKLHIYDLIVYAYVLLLSFNFKQIGVCQGTSLRPSSSRQKHSLISAQKGRIRRTQGALRNRQIRQHTIVSLIWNDRSTIDWPKLCRLYNNGKCLELYATRPISSTTKQQESEPTRGPAHRPPAYVVI